MIVYFIGVGPGVVDLIIFWGCDLIVFCLVCLYVGFLVFEVFLFYCFDGVCVVNIVLMDLVVIVVECKVVIEVG